MQCPQCFVGLCRQHLLQDSGKRSQGILDQVLNNKYVSSLLSKGKYLVDQEKKLNAIHSKLIQQRLDELQV
jgi:hypothetical protein